MKTDDKIKLDHEELNLEDLIIMGDDKKIPIEIEFPRPDGGTVKARALIKQLTMGELDDIKIINDNPFAANLLVLELALFKSNGEHFSIEELKLLPIGVVNAIAAKVMEISGVNLEEQAQKLKDF